MALILADIDLIIVNMCKMLDYINLRLVNKYFNNLVLSVPIVKVRAKLIYRMKNRPDADKFIVCCANGFIDDASTILCITQIDISVHDNEAFKQSCENGHIDVAKWLIKNDKEKSIGSCLQQSFNRACANGCLDMAKWLRRPIHGYWININIHFDQDYAFRLACCNGHLNVIQWLVLEDKSNRINIHSCNEFAFRNSCINGHLIIAKYLLQLGKNRNMYGEIDIYCADKYYGSAFCTKHTDVIEWLRGLDVGLT